MGDAVEVVIPKEASAAAPYAISLVKGGPNPNSGKLWLNFIMSEAGQSLFAQGFVRPSVPGIALSADVAAKMPAAPQIRPLDVVKASAAKPEVDKLWAAAVLAK
jgi:putative spermidine/putrescine transport system substrate-binding protein